MQTKSSLILRLCVCLSLVYLLASITAHAADPQPVMSDGSILTYDFEDSGLVKNWEKHGNGDLKIEKGELAFAQAAGDNAVDTPKFKKPFGKNDEYVLQLSFRITKDADVAVPFMIVGLITDEGGVAWRTNFKVATAAKDDYTVGVQDPQQVAFKPKLQKDHMYVVTIHVVQGEAHYFLFDDENDRVGAFLGTTKLDSNSATWVRIGNVFGAGSGAQVQDNVLIGNPRPPGPLAVSPRGRLTTVWGAIKTHR